MLNRYVTEIGRGVGYAVGLAFLLYAFIGLFWPLFVIGMCPSIG